VDKEFELLKQNKHSELWQICCGFIDLSLNNFMKIQQHLLIEQIGLLKHCELGKVIMKGKFPSSVNEFRQSVPLTTYADYAPYFLNRDSSVLPEEPVSWHHTSGRYGEYSQKWIPITARQYQELGTAYLAGILFSSCSCKGSIILQLKDKLLDIIPSHTSFSGTVGKRVNDMGIFELLSPLPDADATSFVQSVQSGLYQALYSGMDYIICDSNALITIGEIFSDDINSYGIKYFSSRPKVFFRLCKGYTMSKITGRRMLPKDIWKLKGLISNGAETRILKEKIKQIWGRYPLDIYATTESMIIAMQTWDRQGMTFLPHINFLEFIREDDSMKAKEDAGYQPPTFLLDEARAGEKYELVITNLLGGSMVRYKTGDMIKIISQRDKRPDVGIPQMLFHSRIDELIEMGGEVRLTESTIWQAIENTRIPYLDWAARKEIIDNKPILHVYMETKDQAISECQIVLAIDTEMKKLDDDYARLKSPGEKSPPITVTILPEDSFKSYMAKTQADQTNITFIHINPSEKMLELLLAG